MTKYTKSVRLDEGIVQLVDAYCDFLTTLSGKKVTFSKIIPDALVCYIANNMERTVQHMKEQSIYYFTDTGKPQQCSFAKEEIERAEDLFEWAFGEMATRRLDDKDDTEHEEDETV